MLFKKYMYSFSRAKFSLYELLAYNRLHLSTNKFKMQLNFALDEDGGRKVNTVQRRKQYEPSGIKSIAVNSDEFLLRGVDNIPADEIFFFR